MTLRCRLKTCGKDLQRYDHIPSFSHAHNLVTLIEHTIRDVDKADEILSPIVYSFPLGSFDEGGQVSRLKSGFYFPPERKGRITWS